MSTVNQAAVGNAAGSYGMLGGLGSYLSNSLGNYLQTGISSGNWGKGNLTSAFNAKAGIGAVAGFAGGLLDKSAAHQRTSGKYGNVAQTVDIVGDIAGSAANFNPIATGAGRLAMGAVNKITGGTDGMTVQDSLLGSGAVQGALTGLAAATGPIGWGVAGAYLLASGINAATGKTTTDNAYKSFMDKDKMSEVADAYSDMDLENEAESLYNKKYGGFSMGAYKKALKKIEKALMRMTDKIDIRDTAKLGQIRAGMVDANRLNYQMAINGGYKPLAIGKKGLKITPERMAEAKRIAKCIKQKKRNVAFTNVIPAEAREAMRDVTKVPNDALPFFKEGGNIELFQNGGDVNVIPEGALHARKHHMENDEHITKKGIPVVDLEGKQLAEIERNEIIFRKEVTDKLEKLAKDGSDEAAIEAGKLLAQEIIENTDDRTGLIQQVTEDSLEKIPKAAGGFDFSKIGQYASIASAATNVLGMFKSAKQTDSALGNLSKVEQEIEELKNRKGERFAAENIRAMSESPAKVDENGNVVTSYDPEEALKYISEEELYQKQRALLDLETRRKQLAKGIETSNLAALGYQTGLLNNVSEIAGMFSKKSPTGNDPNKVSTANAANITKVATEINPNIPDKIEIKKDGDKFPNPSLEEYIELKIKERTEAAIKKATTRKTGYKFKNKSWKNCIATATDNYGVPICLRNSDLAADPKKYGFEELLFGDNTDTLPDGVLILDYNKPNDYTTPGHTIMLVGRTETGAPIYSYSSGSSDPADMHNSTTNYFFDKWNDKVKPRAYRYIGTPAERKAWEEEYNTLYPKKFESGGILEELSKLSPEKLEELKNILKYLNQ